MLEERIETIRAGRENGSDMIVRVELPSGLEIYGLATRNVYDGEWDNGPTWNYVVLGDQKFLVDTGRFGQGPALLEMMAEIGLSGRDLDFVVITHGHEDHDGGLNHIVRTTGASARAHRIYDRMTRLYPDDAPSEAKKNFPASCWHCVMPIEFSSKNCIAYHQEVSGTVIDGLDGNEENLGEAVRVHHVPGHSPDCLAFVAAGEAIMVGDAVLPEVTPIPTTERYFDHVKGVLGAEYTDFSGVCGLRTFIRSLKKLRAIGRDHPGIVVLPAHRLFYRNQWHDLDLAGRVDELIGHHIDRCADVLRILASGPKTAREIAAEHFEERLLKGLGSVMAENEINSHLELLVAAGDVQPAEDGRWTATGGHGFEAVIESLEAA
ncbi:MAG: MBL fold metallo-hydrolase [Proteobacteria bacterium]|nr:MBL fold metallo-hydrolase [Pseudomonadota bacterium]